MNKFLQQADDLLNEQQAKIDYLNTKAETLTAQVNGLMTAGRFEQLYAAARALDKASIAYVFGGEAGTGMDCSGFTQTSFAAVGIDIPRTSLSQSLGGRATTWPGARPGALLFFKLTSRAPAVDHVGIFLGNDEMMHTNNANEGIHISKVSGSFLSHMVAVREYL